MIARAKYKVVKADPLPDDATVLEQDGSRFTIVTAPLPRLLIRRGLLAPSMLARVIIQKFRFGETRKSKGHRARQNAIRRR